MEQSKLAVPKVMRGWFMGKMNQFRDLSLAQDGDVGPDGANLLETYGDKGDRRMFVALMGAPEVVVGCCAVKIGMDEKAVEPESGLCSIWRMSVDETYRGHGIATKLMAKCEDWARGTGRAVMRLYTINPVAAKFYVDRMGYAVVDQFQVVKFPIVRRFVPPVRVYEKALTTGEA